MGTDWLARFWLWAVEKQSILSRQLMPLQRLIAWSLSLGGGVIQAALLWVLWDRKVFRRYPRFFFYTVVQVVKFWFILWTRSYPILFFFAYWIGEIIDVAVVLAVLYELYTGIFRGYEGLRRLQDILFRWSAAISILLAVIAAAAAPGSDSDRILAGLLAFDLAVAVLKAGLIILLLLLSSALALRWSHYAFGILVGMGLYNTVQIATVTIRAQIGPVATFPYQVLKVAAYDCALVLWLWYFIAKQTSSVVVTSVPDNDLSSWNRELLRLIR